MAVFGSISRALVSRVRTSFETRCIALLENACMDLKVSKTINTDWCEENITANIYTYIFYNADARTHGIYVESEHSFFNPDVLDNRKKAKSSPRIDLVFQHDWHGQRMIFFVEAKNIVVNDYVKTGRKTIVKAISVQKRYISTGIDHYLSGYYTKGCMLAYVLNGSTVGAVNGLNSLLDNAGRTTEQLVFVYGSSPWLCFKSNHAAQGVELMHYIMEFC